VKLVLATLAALALAVSVATSARAADAPAVIVSVVSFVAGHPTQVACDADTNFGPTGPPPQDFSVEAWTPYGTGPVHVLPKFCTEALSPVGSPAFAEAIRVFVHEAAHARGVVREDCAELTADIGVFDVLRLFYHVPFFTPLSWKVGSQVLALTRIRPPNYQPEGCWH
jgi:hypothetical protein